MGLPTPVLSHFSGTETKTVVWAGKEENNLGGLILQGGVQKYSELFLLDQA